MKLNILQRILIFSVLPKEGSLLTMKTLKNLKEKIVFSEEEIKESELRIEDNQYFWNPTKVGDVEFDITEGETKLIVEGLKDLDKQGKITEQYLTLCELFNVE
jgi:hypothetical protein